MRFDFFTLGGSQLWADLFFYQKWRIQKYFESKKCRLLDPWDIKRHEGSFESCLEAFYKYIEIYELPRQKGHMVIMLHGLFDSKNIFKPLWRELIKYRFVAAALNYPSSQLGINAHVNQLETFLDNLVDISEVSFVTKGIGALILRELLSRTNRNWQQKIKIKRIVEIAPPNQGSKLFAYLSKIKICNMIFGPMLKDASPKKVAYLPNIDQNIELTIIDCKNPWLNILQTLPYDINRKLFNENEAYVEKNKNLIKLKNWKLNPLKNQKILSLTIDFLKNGQLKK